MWAKKAIIWFWYIFDNAKCHFYASENGYCFLCAPNSSIFILMYEQNWISSRTKPNVTAVGFVAWVISFVAVLKGISTNNE